MILQKQPLGPIRMTHDLVHTLPEFGITVGLEQDACGRQVIGKVLIRGDGQKKVWPRDEYEKKQAEPGC